MSSHGKATVSAAFKAPRKGDLPADDVQSFRALLKSFLSEQDAEGRTWASARWGVYAFFDYEGEPIYVGQTNEQLRVRVQRHLTNQRTDAVAMRILDIFEVAEVAVWPLWTYQNLTKRKDPEAFRDAQLHLNSLEYTVYLTAIRNSQYHAILNEKIPPISPECELPPSLRRPLISEHVRAEREHADIRIARRAEAIARLAAVARERGEVSSGLRRALVVQAIRLTHLSAQRLAYAEGRERPDASVIDVLALVGSVTQELAGDHDAESIDGVELTLDSFED